MQVIIKAMNWSFVVFLIELTYCRLCLKNYLILGLLNAGTITSFCNLGSNNVYLDFSFSLNKSVSKI